jgi:hypothetical protein
MPSTAYRSGRTAHCRSAHTPMPSWSNFDEQYTTRELAPAESLVASDLRDDMRNLLASRASEWVLADDLRRRLFESVRSQSELLGSNLARLLLVGEGRWALVGSGSPGIQGSGVPQAEEGEALKPRLERPPALATARAIESIANATGLPAARKVVFHDEAE